MSKKRFEDAEDASAIGAPPQLDDVIENVTQFQEDEAGPVKKKRSPLPFILAGGVVLAGVLGSVGFMVMSNPTAAPADDYSMLQPPPLPAPGAPQPAASSLEAPLASAAPASAPASALDIGAAPVALPNPGTMHGAPPAGALASAQPQAVAQPAAVAVAAAPTATATSPMTSAEFERVDRRIDELGREISALRSQRQSQVSTSSHSTSAPPRQRPASTRSGEAAKPPGAEEIMPETRSALARAPKVLPGLSLRAVYPSSGPDMQAWVMDGDSLQVVSRNSVVGGALVIEVQSGMVITDRGVIR